MKIMLFSEMGPCDNFTGGIVIKRLMRFLQEEGHELSLYILDPVYGQPVVDKEFVEGMHFEATACPKEVFTIDGRSAINTACKNIITELSCIRRVAFYVENAIERIAPDIIWVVVGTFASINIANTVYKTMKKPYVVQLWDPLEIRFSSFKTDKFSISHQKKALSRLINNSSCFIASSWKMAEEYGKRYDIRSVAVLPCIELNENRESCIGAKEKSIKEKQTFDIFCAGQIYAIDAIEVFLEAIENYNKSKGEKIRFITYGNGWEDIASRYDFVINRGWIDQPILIEELKEADLLYCPYPFDERFSETSRLSFPSKIVIYFCTGVPTLFHGSDKSGVAEFIRENRAAYTLYSDILIDTINMIETIIGDSDLDREEIGKNGRIAFKKYLTTKSMKSSFLSAFCLEEKNVRLDTVMCDYKILQVNATDLVGSRFNGYDLHIELNKRGVSSKACVLYKESNDYNTTRLIGRYTYETVPLIQEFEQSLSIRNLITPFGWNLVNSVDFKAASLVHYHAIHNYPISLSCFQEAVNKKPSVWTFHDHWAVTGHCVMIYNCDGWKTGCKKCKYLDRFFLMHSNNAHNMWKIKKEIYTSIDIDIVVSTDSMKQIVKESPLTSHFKRIHKIPFGIKCESFSPDIHDNERIKEKLGIPKNNFVIMFRCDKATGVGFNKGLDRIIKMLHILEPKVPVSLLTVGEKHLMDEFKREYSIHEFEWQLYEKSLAEMYAVSDVFLMPSRMETFGVMAIEAMASGKPVIIARGTPLSEVTCSPEYGIEIEGDDEKEFADAVNRLINNPEECKHRGSENRLYALKHYSFERYYNDMVDLYVKIIQRNANNEN